ncbi:MAG: hypothetical protein QW403_01945 [Candidatus Aenigmatarchaeota archaeon]
MAEGQIEEKKVKTGWDYLKEGLKFAKDLVVSTLRAFPRAAVGLGIDIADILQKGRLTGEPEYPQKFGKLGEIILGKEPILPPSAYFRKGGEIGSKTSRFLKKEWGIDIPEPVAKRIGEAGGLAFFALDLIPVWPGKSLVSKSVLRTLAKETNENIIKAIVKREVPQLTDEVIEKIAPQIAKAQKSKDVLRILRSGFKESEGIKRATPFSKEVVKKIPTKPSVPPPEPPKKPPLGTSFPNDDIARFIFQPKEKRVMSSLWQNVLKKGVIDETTLREILGEEAGTYLRRNRAEFWNQLENKLERAGFKNVEQLYKMIMNDWRSVRNKVTGERIKFEQDELEMLGIKLFKHFVDNKEWIRASKLAEKLTTMAVKAGRGVEIYRAVPEAIRIQLKPFILKNQILDYASKYNIELSERAVKELDKITQDFMEKSTQMGYKEFEKYLSDTIFEFAKKHLPPLSWKERIDIIRTGGVLFNPWSAYRNVFSNAFQAFVLRPATLTTQVLVSYLRSLRNPDIEKVTLSNVASYYKSMLGSLGFAFDSFLEVMRKGVSSEKILETMTKEGIDRIIEMGRYAGTNDFLTRISKWPLNFLEATDIFFATLIKEGEKLRLIDLYKQAGKKITPRLLEEIEEKAGEVAARFLFREKLGQRERLKELGPLAQLFDVLGDHLLQLKNRMKTVSPAAYYAFSPFVLFVRTPINIAKLMLEYSPDILFASSKTSESYAKALLGSMAMGIGAWFAFNGRTTFLPPSDSEERELWYSAGNKPFSIRLPSLELNVPVWYFGPLALPLIIPAAATWATKELKVEPDKKTEQQIIAATLGILRFIGEQTSLTGLNSFFKTLAGEVDYTLSQTLTFTGSQFIPLSGLWRTINRVLDPIYRQAGKDVPDSLKKEFSAYYKIYLEATGKSPEEIEKLMPQPYLRLTPEGTIEQSRREWWQMVFPWELSKAVPELQREYEREIEQRQLRTEARGLIPREIREKREKKEIQSKARALFIYAQNRSIPKAERIKVIKEKLAENPEIEEEFMNLLEEERLRKILPPTIPPEIKRWSIEERAYFIDAWMKKQRQVGVSKQEILNVLEVLQDEGIITDRVIDILYELKYGSPVSQETQ